MLIQAGFDLEMTSYFARSEEGLWIKSVWDLDTGNIHLNWHERHEVVGGRVVRLDENQSSISSEPVQFNRYDSPWVLAGSVNLDSPEFLEFSRGLVEPTIYAIMRHLARLAALGWGDTASEVVEWFGGDLSTGEFILPSKYLIANGSGIFGGIDGLLLEVQEFQDGALKSQILVEGHESYQFDRDLGAIEIRDFLVSTEPI